MIIKNDQSEHAATPTVDKSLFAEFEALDTEQSMVDRSWNVSLPVSSAESDIQEVSLDLLDDFKGHTFKKRDDLIDQLAESIKENGVLNPAVVRAKGFRYEIIEGHHRRWASEKAGLTKMPIRVIECSDEEAVKRMIESNIQRDERLLSDTVRSCKAWMDANKKPGKRTDLCTAPDEESGHEYLARVYKVGTTQICRYIKLATMIDELIDMLDAKMLGFTPAYEIACIDDKDSQRLIASYIVKTRVKLTEAMASEIKRVATAKVLTTDDIEAIVNSQTPKPIKRTMSNKQVKEICSLFPAGTTPDEMFEFLKSMVADQYGQTK